MWLTGLVQWLSANVVTEFDEVEIERHHQHRLLSNNLALNKAALEEAKRQQVGRQL
jgi:hypothetical protein